jgi:hypothetical protein
MRGFIVRMQLGCSWLVCIARKYLHESKGVVQIRAPARVYALEDPTYILTESPSQQGLELK